MKLVIAFSTFLLCLVTLSTAVLFWASMPTDQFGKLLAAITATALEACKYTFFPAGIYYIKRRNLGGAGLLLVGVVLVGISVAATTGFLENAYQQQTQVAQQSSLEYQTKKQQLSSLQQQIDTLNSLVSADAAGSYRARAYENSRQVKILEDQRNSALDDLKSYRNSPQGSAQSFFASMAVPIGVQPDAVRQAAFMGLAVIVDICAIAALLALSGLGLKRKPETPSEAAKTEKTENQKVNSIAAKSKAAEQIVLTENESRIATQIIAGEYGQPLSVREIISKAHVSHAVVKKILDHLVSMNKVRREGKRFQLVQNVIF